MRETTHAEQMVRSAGFGKLIGCWPKEPTSNASIGTWKCQCRGISGGRSRTSLLGARGSSSRPVAHLLLP